MEKEVLIKQPKGFEVVGTIGERFSLLSEEGHLWS